MPDSATSWETYRERELAWAVPALRELGYELEELQPHMGGERFLMQAVTTTSGPKLILLVRRVSDGTRAVAKVTSDASGTKELMHERLCRSRLAELRFAYRGFFVPEELHFSSSGGRTVSLQKFIEQERPFLARPTPKQFDLALAAFKAQESAHAATYEQEQSIVHTFGMHEASAYQQAYAGFVQYLKAEGADDTLLATLDEGAAFLASHQGFLYQYSGFLTHTDFVPHNIRVVGNAIYLLDASALRFGNKYEGWARFINFMELYNPELARVLVRYVADNRTPEETLALRAMRIYRLGEIITYYARTLPRSEGDLKTLNEARINFWANVMRAVLGGTQPSPALIEEYSMVRDRLRSPEEKVRQKDLH